MCSAFDTDDITLYRNTYICYETYAGWGSLPTLETQDVGMVSSTGNGRRYAAQALLGSLAQREHDVLLTAVLVYASRLGPAAFVGSGNWKG